MFTYRNLQNLNTDKHTKKISYYSELPENGIVIGKVDLSNNMPDRNSEKYLKTDNGDFEILPIDSDDIKNMKGFIPVKQENDNTIYYVAIEKIFKIPIWLLGMIPLLAVFVVALSVAIPAALRPENKPTNDPIKNPIIVAEDTVTPNPIATPEPTIIPTEIPNTNQEPIVSESPSVKDNITTVIPMVTKAPVVTKIPAQQQKNDDGDNKKDNDTDEKNVDVKVTPTISPSPTITPTATPGPTKVPDPVTTPTPAPVVTPVVTPEPKPVPVATPTPKPAQEPDTPHVHNYIVEEKEPTCTDLGYYKKYCKDCGYVIADHTCTAKGHALEAVGVSNMTYPNGMTAEYKCKRCGETVTDNFDYTSGLYRADGTLMYTYDALEQLFDWNLSTTPAKALMDAHAELTDGRILVLPSWNHLMEVAEESGADDAMCGTEVDDSAFNGSILTEVVLPDNTPYLGWWFNNCNIEKLSLPDSITEYKGQVNDNNNLHYVKLSANTPVVNTFYNDPNIWTIIIPEGVTKLSGYTFSNIRKNADHPMDITLPNSIIEFHDSFHGSYIRTLTIPGSVKTLPNMTAWNFEKLVLEEGVEEISGYFYDKGNSSLIELNTPSTLKKIGDVAFVGNLKLTKVILKDGFEKFGDNVFAGSIDMKQINKIILPNSLELSENEVPLIFSSSLNLVVYPEEVEYFGSGSPYIYGGKYSDTPTKVIMPSIIHHIQGNAVLLFPSMEEIVLPGGDYSDVSLMFSNCTNLKKITFTGEITGMKGDFFSGVSSSLKDIYYYGSEESLQKVQEDWERMHPDGASVNAFMNATIHYMTGNPPTREDLLKEYGVADDVYGLYSDEAYAEVVAEKEANKITILSAENPITILQQNELTNFVSQSANVNEEHTHTLSIEEKAPTCTEDGYYRVTCSTCGETLAEHICHKLGHSMRMVDPEDNTTDIIVPKYKCDRCDYEETTEHTHSWVAKGIENMTYPEGGDSVYICETCLAKKTEHVDAVPGMYDQDGKLKYTYEQLENDFGFDLSTTKLYVIQNNHPELKNMSSLVLPSYDHLLSVATNNGKSSIFTNSCFGGASCDEIVLPDGITTIETSWFQGPCVKRLVIPDSVQTIKQSAFSGCMNLEKITFPETIKTLESPLFSSSGIKNIVLPKNLENDFVSGAPIIVYESQLESLSIPGGHAIPASFVIQCPKLETLTIMGKVPSIDINAFQGCGLKNVYYYGSEDSMNQIITDAGGSPFGNAEIHYMNEAVTNIAVESNLAITVSSENATTVSDGNAN